jgi:hypothetical protein
MLIKHSTIESVTPASQLYLVRNKLELGVNCNKLLLWSVINSTNVLTQLLWLPTRRFEITLLQAVAELLAKLERQYRWKNDNH